MGLNEWWKEKKERFKKFVRDGSGTTEIIELIEILVTSINEIDEQNKKLQESIARLEQISSDLLKASKFTFWMGIISLSIGIIALLISIIILL